MEIQNKRAVEIIQRDIDNLNLILDIKRDEFDKLIKDIDKKRMEIEEKVLQIEEQKLALKKLQPE